MKKDLSRKKAEYRLQLELHGEKISVVSSCEQIIIDIAIIYDHFIRTTATGEGTYHGIAVTKSKAFRILYQDELIYSNQSSADTLLFLEWFINTLFLRQLKHFLQIHAGVVARNNKGIIFPAINEVGKSTFTFYLVQKGFNYYSDEIGFIDITSKRVFPFPKSIGLVKDTYHEVLKQFDYCPFKTTCNSDKVLYQPRIRQKDLANGAPLQYIFFLKRERILENPLTECPKGIGLVELIKNSFNPLAYGEESFNQLTKLLAQTKMFFLDVTRLDHAYQSVCEVLAL